MSSPRFQECITRVFDYCSPELNYNGRLFKIATDMKIGLNWGGYNKELNPTGMREVKDWNATQLDGRVPITLRTADSTGRILKHLGPNERPAPRYAYYM